MSSFFVSCPRGVEPVTERELLSLGIRSTQQLPGGVSFEGNQDDLYRAHLWLRTGNRILLNLRRFPVRDPEELYDAVGGFRWETFLRPGLRFAVDCKISGRSSPSLSHSHFARLKAKDAIVDRMRAKTGSRPDVDTDAPDISVHLLIRDGECTLSMDATGDPLHLRGYRGRGAVAPLKETLAAAILLSSGWTPDQPLVDPMCGSGTLLCEAALMLANVAPGALRARFSFMNWPDFHEPRWKQHLAAAEQSRRPLPGALLSGSDRDPQAIRQTQLALKLLGFSELVSLRCSAFAELSPPPGTPGWLVTNPPYGERLGELEPLRALYRSMGDLFKQRWTGWQAALFVGSRELAKEIGLRAERRIPLWNGPIECRLLTFRMYPGSDASARRTEAVVTRQQLQQELDLLALAQKSVQLVRKLSPLAESWGGEHSPARLCGQALHRLWKKGWVRIFSGADAASELFASDAEERIGSWAESGFESELGLGYLATEAGLAGLARERQEEDAGPRRPVKKQRGRPARN